MVSLMNMGGKCSQLMLALFWCLLVGGAQEATAKFWQHITEISQDAQAPYIPWIGIGDWEQTPEEMSVCTNGYTLERAVRNSDGSPMAGAMSLLLRAFSLG